MLDTDAFNEIDDQFAVVQAILSPERIQLEAIYAAPFFNERSRSPGHGMQLSFEEIGRLLNADWAPSMLVPSPILTDQITYRADRTRHLVRYVTQVQRDPIFQDFIEKLSRASSNRATHGIAG